MRWHLPLLVLISGGLLFSACSKKSTPASTPPPAAPAPATTTAAPAATDTSDTGVSFNLSGSKPGDTGTSATDTFMPSKPAGEDTSEAPRMISRVFPFYPLSMRMQGIEGRVDVRVLINTEGRVERAEVLSSTEPKFSEYALAAARLCRFTPAKENGKPVPLTTGFSVPFVSEFGTGSMPDHSPLAHLAYLSGEYYSVNETGKLAPAEYKVPVALLQLQPDVPVSAKPGETLTAKVRFTLSDEGQVMNPVVTNSTNAEFTHAIAEVMPFWQFIPRIKNGKAVSGPVELPFTLKVPEKGSH